MDLLSTCLHEITSTHPELTIHTAMLLADGGQFNIIIQVNDRYIFRFPRSAEVAGLYDTQKRLLAYLHDRLPLPIPDPQFSSLPSVPWQRTFMGYSRIPGAPLDRETLCAIPHAGAVKALGKQLGSFLRSLHQTPLNDLPVKMDVTDGVDDWTVFYQGVRRTLFPHMKPAARRAVENHFDRYLSDESQFAFRPALRHGDFGPTNILYDSSTQRIGGVLDFEELGIGDPAIDIGPLVGYGETFLESCMEVYPSIHEMLGRVHFYRGTYALQEAYFGLRDGDQRAFERGMLSYQ